MATILDSMQAVVIVLEHSASLFVEYALERIRCELKRVRYVCLQYDTYCSQHCFPLTVIHSSRLTEHVLKTLVRRPLTSRESSSEIA